MALILPQKEVFVEKSHINRASMYFLKDRITYLAVNYNWTTNNMTFIKHGCSEVSLDFASRSCSSSGWTAFTSSALRWP